MKPDKNEQWLLDGKCSICRRKNYCKTQCKKFKQYQETTIRGMVSNMLKSFTSKR